MRSSDLCTVIAVSCAMIACEGGVVVEMTDRDSGRPSTTDAGPAVDGQVPRGDGGGGSDGGPPACDEARPCPAGERCNAGRCEPIADTEMRTSIEQYGITWTFSEARPTGRFVTGDYWVVGPVEIVSITPEPTGTRNGSMIDPVGHQAYDSRAGRYDEDKGVELPLMLEGGHSLVSSISHPAAAECMQGSSNGWLTYDGGCQRGPIDTHAVLTVLAEAPPADAFRPAYSRHGPRLYRAADICWARLPALPPPAGTPDAEPLLRHVERPWIDHLNSWQMQHGCATSNMYCYGREIGQIVSTLATYVLLDAPERQAIALRLVQLGIDNHGVLRAGGGWGGDGGHFNGRKFPIVFAGGLLGDEDMMSPGTEIGNEDRMTYYGTDGTALWGRACTSCYLGNGCDNSGDCTSGAKDCRDPEGRIDGCDSYRNCCTSRTWVGQALAVHAMGLRAAWGHEPFFDYVDRWMNGDVSGGGSSARDFVDAMWSAHRGAAPSAGCP